MIDYQLAPWRYCSILLLLLSFLEIKNSTIRVQQNNQSHFSLDNNLCNLFDFVVSVFISSHSSPHEFKVENVFEICSHDVKHKHKQNKTKGQKTAISMGIM